MKSKIMILGTELGAMAAQGELLVEVAASIPDGYTASTEETDYVVGHSETGHHHTVPCTQAEFFENVSNPMVCYLQVSGGFADLEHHRDFDTHSTIRMPKGVIKITRQREGTMGEWDRVAD